MRGKTLAQRSGWVISDIRLLFLDHPEALTDEVLNRVDSCGTVLCTILTLMSIIMINNPIMAVE